ncbi:MAG: M20/M25/M40 family metallo-hydrolase [Caldilineaceae bacterium]
MILNLEIRGLDDGVLDQAEDELRTFVEAAGATFAPLSGKPPVQSDPRLLDALSIACKELDLAYRLMPSGAGHDAMNMAALCPMAMIFVPSANGVSHSPDEYTPPQDCINGAHLLLAGLIKIDQIL